MNYQYKSLSGTSKQKPKEQSVKPGLVRKPEGGNEDVKIQAIHMTTEILTKRILNYSEMQQTNDYTQGDSDVILFHIYATFLQPSCG